MVKVLLVEDDCRLRESLALLLSERCEVRSVAGKAEALRCLDEFRFDVSLVDLGLPDGSGLDVISEIHRAGGRALVLTSFGDEDTVLAAIARGAAGYLLKSDCPVDMYRQIERCFAGDAPISPGAAKHLFAQHRAPPFDALTDRERELLLLLAKGLSYAECASALGITVGTVQTYVKALYRKLDVCSKAEATLWATRHRLI